MRWPSIFEGVLSGMHRATLELYNLVPAECAIGQRIGFEVELLATLIMPAALVALLLLYAKALAPFAHREGGKRTLMDWPQIW